MSMPAGDLPEVVDLQTHGQKAAAAYRSVRHLYLDYASSLKEVLEAALHGRGIRTQAVDARAKSLESFARKAGLPSPSDPNRPRYEDPVRQITDMAGVRVVTFLPGAVEQVDAIVRAELCVLEKEDKGDALNQEERFGYSSVHYLVRLGADRDSLPEHRRFADLVGEIQVRTILQHAWAEIEHDIQYKSAGAIPGSIRRRFMAVAGMLEIADREFQAIQDEDRRRRSAATESVEEGRLAEAELVPDALRSYLDRRLGEDKRIGSSNYEAWTRVLQELGFTSIQQVDDCISGLDDLAVSRHIWGARRGQLMRFEGLLLAGMGERYIERHPSHGLDWFVGVRRRWLDRLLEHGAPVRNYRPPG